MVQCSQVYFLFEEVRTKSDTQIIAPITAATVNTGVPNTINNPRPSGFPSSGPNTLYSKIGAAHKTAKTANVIVNRFPTLVTELPVK
jgi:hypothetical protein